jgi:Family of unknown function (DUF5995)
VAVAGERRAAAGIEPAQFALAGMNAHINHDLPLAMVSTCMALAIDQLLDVADGAGSNVPDVSAEALCA